MMQVQKRQKDVGRDAARLRVSSVNVPKPSGFEGGENIVREQGGKVVSEMWYLMKSRLILSIF